MVKITYQANGIDAYVKALELLSKTAEGAIKRAVYEGAAEYGKEMLTQIDALQVNEYHYISGDLPIYGITPKQKAGLREGFGFAKMQNDNGFINTKAGFDDYNGEKTKRYPNGQPNAMIANAVNSGTSRRPKTGFVNKAIKNSKNAILSAMQNRFDEDTKNMMKE